MGWIVEAQEYKIKKQVAAVKHSCHSKHKNVRTKLIAGWFHIGYLRLVCRSEMDAALFIREYKQCACSLNVRLVIREYCNEYLIIDKPYYENIERLRTCLTDRNMHRVCEPLGWMLETQVEIDYYIYLASRGTKACSMTGTGNWCHLSYCEATYDDYDAAIDAVAIQERLDVEQLGADIASRVRYVVRACSGEVRDVVHTYKEYKSLQQESN